MKLGRLKNRTIIKQTLILLFCGFVGWYLKGKLTPQAPMAMGAGSDPYVLTQEVEEQDISPYKTYIGHVEAIKSVNLQPQVTGYVEKVLFQEGSLVNEGDILFVIEQKRYLANIELRQAELAKAKANLVRIQKDYKRQVSLNRQKFASEAKLDTAESDLQQAKAAVKQAEANLDLAEIDLGYTEIKAPITGYIGKALVTEGNYVSSASQTLARIVQINPIRVAFSVSDKDFLDTKLLRQQQGDEAIKTELELPNGTIITNHLKSVFADNEVNSETATIAIYNEYDNEQNLLIPGNYINVRIKPKDDVIALLIPQAAIAQDEHGNYVITVNDENVAEQKRVILGDVIGDKQIVTAGLNEGDKVIIQGLQKVRNGQKVKASLVTPKGN